MVALSHYCCRTILQCQRQNSHNICPQLFSGQYLTILGVEMQAVELDAQVTAVWPRSAEISVSLHAVDSGSVGHAGVAFSST